MTIEKVELELTNNHPCTGVVISCEETGRTIASFWHESDAEEVMMKVNNYDKLVEFGGDEECLFMDEYLGWSDGVVSLLRVLGFDAGQC